MYQNTPNLLTVHLEILNTYIPLLIGLFALSKNWLTVDVRQVQLVGTSRH